MRTQHVVYYTLMLVAILSGCGQSKQKSVFS